MSESKLEWLPDILNVKSWRNDTYEYLYKIFVIDFIKDRPIYKNKRITIPPKKEDGKEQIFWHLTSEKDRETGERFPNIRRCERLVWIKPVIEHAHEPEVMEWDFENHTKKRIETFIWLKEYDFIVIMKKLKNSKHLLLTAFCLSHKRRIKMFEEKFNKRIKRN
jgi:hypothetical protein